MKKIEILIIDNHLKLAEMLYSTEIFPPDTFQLRFENFDNVERIFSLIVQNNFDLIISNSGPHGLDNYMGVELGIQLTNSNISIPLIFISNSPETNLSRKLEVNNVRFEFCARRFNVPLSPDDLINLQTIIKIAKEYSARKKNTKKILMVDDERDLVDSFAELIQVTGYNVDTAYNGKDAIALFESDEYDCIVSDIDMPKMNGIDFALEVRKINLKIPIIFFTGRLDNKTKYANELSNISKHQFVEKLGSHESLLDAIKALS